MPISRQHYLPDPETRGTTFTLHFCYTAGWLQSGCFWTSYVIRTTAGSGSHAPPFRNVSPTWLWCLWCRILSHWGGMLWCHHIACREPQKSRDPTNVSSHPLSLPLLYLLLSVSPLSLHPACHAPLAFATFGLGFGREDCGLIPILESHD